MTVENEVLFAITCVGFAEISALMVRSPVFVDDVDVDADVDVFVFVKEVMGLVTAKSVLTLDGKLFRLAFGLV